MRPDPIFDELVMSEQVTNEAEQSLHDSHQALMAFKAGQLSGFGQYAETLRPYLKQVVRNELGLDAAAQSPDDPSDIVQQSLVKAVEKLCEFRGSSVNEWRAWLVAIARNEVRMSKRFWNSEKRSRQRVVTGDMIQELDGNSDTPSSELRRAELRAQLDRAMSQLSNEQRQIIEWRQTDRLSHADIGAKLGISVDAARQRCKSAMDALRQCFRGPA